MAAYRVSLQKVKPCCPSCGAPRTVRTALVGGTVIRTTCSPYQCRIARTIALAGGARPSSFEPLPVDDRNVSKDRFGRGAA